MTAITHIVDDTALGGVMRMLDTMSTRMAPGIRHRIVKVSKRQILLPRLEGVVLVHLTAGWAKLPLLGALRVACTRRPIILVEHTYTAAFERLHVPNRERFRRMLSLTYRLFDGIVSVSQGQADWILSSGLTSAPKLHVIPSIADCDAFFALPAVRREGPLRLGAYGRYVDQKGFDVLIEAVRRLPPDMVSLTIAGTGPEEDRLRAAAAGAGNIEIGCVISDPAAWMADIDVIAVPSRYEAFGLVALEARAAGRPVIASAVDGLIEQVSPAAGLLVPSDDPAALAAAIVRMRAADICKLGRSARQSAVGHMAASLAAWENLIGEADIRHHRTVIGPALSPS